MGRTFLQLEDLHDLVAEQFGSARTLAGLERLAGGSKKGVYRLRLDDESTAIVYSWAAGENFWPGFDSVPDDPFTDASGAELFAVNHAALVAAGVRVPRLVMLDRDRRYLDADLAVVEDAGGTSLEAVMEGDPAGATATLSALGENLRRMHTSFADSFGKLADIARGEASQARRPEAVIVDRALGQLDAAAGRDARIAAARGRIATRVRHLRDRVAPRRRYALVHGELGPDHVLVSPAGEPVIIDIEGVAYFDVEWEHAWLQMRFADAYPALRPVEVDQARLDLYRYAQTLSLIEAPLRIADTDFPDRQWMLNLAEWNISKALREL